MHEPSSPGLQSDELAVFSGLSIPVSERESSAFPYAKQKKPGQKYQVIFRQPGCLGETL